MIQSSHAPAGMEHHTDYPRYMYSIYQLLSFPIPTLIEDGDKVHHGKINFVTELWLGWSSKKFQCIHLSWKHQTLCKTRHLFVHTHVNMIRTLLYYTMSSCQAYQVRSIPQQNRSHNPTDSYFCMSVLQGCLYTIKGTQWRLCTKCMYQ